VKDAKKYKEKNFSNTIGDKERLRLKAKRNRHSVWSGFGLFGMVGWSVAVPSLLGVALGMWLDKKYSQNFSWTLTCFFAGLITGCLIAWGWVSKENKEIHKNSDTDDE
jgi:ATP synthase protein I